MSHTARPASLHRLLMAVACLTGIASCGGDEMFGPRGATASGNYVWNLPPGFPTPEVPADNPMSVEKVELGRHLFYDTRLSGNGSMSCASCHEQARAFSDGRLVGIGSTGEAHPRNSMALSNVGYASVLNWANPNIIELEKQALIPMFGEHPVELGLSGREAELLRRVRVDTTYLRLFAAGFPGVAEPVSVATITKALASFERALVSGNSPYDRYKFRNERTAISESAKRGEALFFSEKAECFHCHAAPIFTGSVSYVGKTFREQEFFNNGLYNLGGTGAYPANNVGIHEFTGRPEDMGAFKAPSLRNVAVSAPYMHDGSIATLEEVVDHYARGGRLITTGPNAGDGHLSPYRNGFITGFEATAQERLDLVEFLRTLTDSTFLTDRRFSNPWPNGRNPAP